MRQDAVERLHEDLGYVWRQVPAGTVTGQEEPVIGLSWDHWIVGALIFLISLWSLSMARSEPVATTTVPPVNRPPRDPLTR